MTVEARHSEAAPTTTQQLREPGEVLGLWERFTRWPGGAALFNRVVGLKVPYAGTISAQVEALEYGEAVVKLREHRRVRNHLNSVHAVALVNLGELTANLALMSMQPRSGRWIVTGMEADYLKKARGLLTARCAVPPLDWSQAQERRGEVMITDEGGAEVVRIRVQWKLGPRPRRSAS